MFVHFQWRRQDLLRGEAKPVCYTDPPRGGCRPPDFRWHVPYSDPIQTPSSRVHHPKSSLKYVQCAIIIGSVFLFNFSTCFSNEIQTDDAKKPVFIGTILHCTYCFWGLRPGLCPWTPLGDFRPTDPLLSPYTPCHYILDKGLSKAGN